MPTIASQVITRGTVRIPEQGDWFADVSTNTGERIPDGVRVDIVIDNLTLSGAIVRGGITGDVGQYQVAGRPEWSKNVKPRADQLTSSVPRNLILSDLCREIFGSSWSSIVELPPAANLGTRFQRPGTFGAVEVTARDVLELLDVPWYVNNAGKTIFATRASGPVSTNESIYVSKRNDAIGYRVVGCEDIAAFAPGLTFEGEIIADLTIAIKPDDIELHVWSRAASNAFADLVRATWRRLFPRVELQGLFSYSTVGPSIDGKHDLRSTRSRHLPDIRTVDAWMLAGHYVELSPGTKALVAFADGDPTQPVIVAVDSSAVPVATSLDASTSININAGTSVTLGGGARNVVINSPDLITWIGAVSTAISVTPPMAYTSAKVKA
jgi:hypothetical protein